MDSPPAADELVAPLAEFIHALSHSRDWAPKVRFYKKQKQFKRKFVLARVPGGDAADAADAAAGRDDAAAHAHVVVKSKGTLRMELLRTDADDPVLPRSMHLSLLAGPHAGALAARADPALAEGIRQVAAGIPPGAGYSIRKHVKSHRGAFPFVRHYELTQKARKQTTPVYLRYDAGAGWVVFHRRGPEGYPAGLRRLFGGGDVYADSAWAAGPPPPGAPPAGAAADPRQHHTGAGVVFRGEWDAGARVRLFQVRGDVAWTKYEFDDSAVGGGRHTYWGAPALALEPTDEEAAARAAEERAREEAKQGLEDEYDLVRRIARFYDLDDKGQVPDDGTQPAQARQAARWRPWAAPKGRSKSQRVPLVLTRAEYGRLKARPGYWGARGAPVEAAFVANRRARKARDMRFEWLAGTRTEAEAAASDLVAGASASKKEREAARDALPLVTAVRLRIDRGRGEDDECWVVWKPHTAEMAELLVDAGVRLVSATWDSAVGYFEQVVQPELEQVGADGAFMYPGISATDTAGTLKRWGVGIPTQMARKIARTMLWRVRTTAALEREQAALAGGADGAGAGAGAGATGAGRTAWW